VRCRAPRGGFRLSRCALSPLGLHAALVNLVRQLVDNTVSGKPELVCVYRHEGRAFERRYPLGNFCPAYEET
jgi:hypothetical protein